MDETPPNASDLQRRKGRFNRTPRAVSERMHRRILVVPSLITVAAFFSGFLAIISAFRGEFEYATKCIAFAFIFDGLDGRVARRLNATTAFGKEFDSLSDVVAFGVAPAIMVYCWAFIEPANDFGVLVAFLFTVCGGARLARFNITSGDSKSPHFQGLPIPAAAAALTSAVYFSPARVTDPMVAGVVALYAIALAFLMVSSIPFLSVKYMRFTQKNMKMLLFALALFVALAWYHSRMFFLAGSLIYVLSGPLLYFREERKKKELAAASNGVPFENPRNELGSAPGVSERH